jgi:hypothetical protein
MTIPEIAAQLRMVLGVCAKANANVSPAERIYFAAAQNECSDEEIISFWLAVSSLVRLSLLEGFSTREGALDGHRRQKVCTTRAMS